MKRIAILTIAVFLVFAGQVNAQDKKKKPEQKSAEEEQVPVFNYVVDDPMDAFGPTAGQQAGPRSFLYPEFYRYWPLTVEDTVVRYECYDINHNPLNMDTLQRTTDVYYINLVKTYNDHLHTMIAQDGSPRPTPISKKLYLYERSGTNMWKAFDSKNNYTSLLQEQMNTIVRTDTTVLNDPMTGEKLITVRKYYKVIEIEKDNVETIGGTPTNNNDPEKTTVTNFLVPEFYFHEPKKVGDTTFEFLCYDNRDSLIPMVTDYEAVRYYSLFKKFEDKAHTYKDNGVEKPLPVSVIIKRYDRTAPEKWMSVEYPSNKFVQLKGFKDNIVTTDTATLYDPQTDRTTLKIFKHYKVIKN